MKKETDQFKEIVVPLTGTLDGNRVDTSGLTDLPGPSLFIDPVKDLKKELSKNVIKPRGKSGPKNKGFHPKYLKKIRQIVLNGAIYDRQIYPALGISETTFYDWKQKFPEITKTIEEAQDERNQQVQQLYDNILYNPSHKEHGRFVKHHFDRIDKRELAKEVVNVNHTFNPLEKVADKDLDKLLEQELNNE